MAACDDEVGAACLDSSMRGNSFGVHVLFLSGILYGGDDICFLEIIRGIALALLLL